MMNILKIHNWFYATNTKRKAILDNDLRLYDNKSIYRNYSNRLYSTIFGFCADIQIKIHYSEDRKLYQTHWNSSQNWAIFVHSRSANISAMPTKESVKYFALISLVFRYYKFLKNITPLFIA